MCVVVGVEGGCGDYGQGINKQRKRLGKRKKKYHPHTSRGERLLLYLK